MCPRPGFRGQRPLNDQQVTCGAERREEVAEVTPPYLAQNRSAEIPDTSLVTRGSVLHLPVSLPERNEELSENNQEVVYTGIVYHF